MKTMQWKVLFFLMSALFLGAVIYIGTRPRDITPPKIVVLQDAPAEWADQLKQGFRKRLEEQGIIDGTDVIIVEKSAAGEPQGLTNLASAISRQEYVMVYALGTQADKVPGVVES